MSEIHNQISPGVKFNATFTSPPKLIPTRKSVDGPVIGNGDVGVVLSGPPAKQRFWISKNDFWKAKPVYPNAGPRPIGGIEIDIPALQGGSYQVNQVLENGTLVGRFTTSIGVIDRQGDAPPFTKAGTTIMIRSWVDAFTNFIFIELSVEGEPRGGDLMSRVFPGETTAVEIDARFENLRAYGAFLVSSALKNGKVEFIRIISEKGRKCTIKNPWIGKQVYVTRENGKKKR